MVDSIKAVVPSDVAPFGHPLLLYGATRKVYLPFAKQQKRPSTYRGYKQVWSDYLERRCKSDWLREVKTHHVQSWLEEIAHEHEISKTTLKHGKNFLSRVFRHAAQQGFSTEQTL